MGRKISEFDIDLATRLYCEQGLTTRAVGKKMNVSYQTVINHLRAAGVSLRKGGSIPKPVPETSEVVRLYEEGVTKAAIARRFRVAYRIIQGILLQSNVPNKRRNEKKIKIDVVEIVNHYNAGKSGEEIGRIFGISAMSVYRRLRDAGVKSRRVGPRKKSVS